jgi:hypothetical protein
VLAFSIWYVDLFFFLKELCITKSNI